MRATRAVQRYGWISFWVQLSLSVVSAVILLFSVAFTSQVEMLEYILQLVNMPIELMCAPMTQHTLAFPSLSPLPPSLHTHTHMCTHALTHAEWAESLAVPDPGRHPGRLPQYFLELWLHSHWDQNAALH
eukprot:1160228-Pelagomonas_calceolata.AAC.3